MKVLDIRARTWFPTFLLHLTPYFSVPRLGNKLTTRATSHSYDRTLITLYRSTSRLNCKHTAAGSQSNTSVQAGPLRKTSRYVHPSHVPFAVCSLRSHWPCVARVTMATASPAPLVHALLLFMFRRCTYPASHNFRALPHRFHIIIFELLPIACIPQSFELLAIASTPQSLNCNASRLSFGMTSTHVLPCSCFRLPFSVQQHRHRFTLFDRPG